MPRRSAQPQIPTLRPTHAPADAEKRTRCRPCTPDRIARGDAGTDPAVGPGAIARVEPDRGASRSALIPPTSGRTIWPGAISVSTSVVKTWLSDERSCPARAAGAAEAGPAPAKAVIRPEAAARPA